MPVHDWPRVEAWIFHAFHTAWCSRLQEALNAGRLPPDYYSLVEQHASEDQPNYRAQRRTLGIRHVSGHRLVAVVEMVSPANKDRLRNVEQFVSKIEAFLDAGVHVLLIDLFPPATCDPHGMHGALGHWVDFSGGAAPLPADHAPVLA